MSGKQTVISRKFLLFSRLVVISTFLVLLYLYYSTKNVHLLNMSVISLLLALSIEYTVSRMKKYTNIEESNDDKEKKD